MHRLLPKDSPPLPPLPQQPQITDNTFVCSTISTLKTFSKYFVLTFPATTADLLQLAMLMFQPQCIVPSPPHMYNPR